MDPSQIFGLQWIYGFSSTIRGAVIDLRTSSREAIAYIAGHTLVIYHPASHTQRLLQGHVHQIQCLAASTDRNYIVSADIGPDAMLIVWDCNTEQAMKSISQQHSHGILAIDFCKDNQYFATLSSTIKNKQQELCIWDMSFSNSEPVLTAKLSTKDEQHCVRFNEGDQNEILTNGKESTFFWKTFKVVSQESGESLEIGIKCEKGEAKFKELKQTPVYFTVSAFVPSTSLAVTATNAGEIIVWENTWPLSSDENVTKNRKTSGNKTPFARCMRALKVVQMHRNAITELVIKEQYIVTGDVDGLVRFYDAHLGIVGWCEELCAGQITSISFSAIDINEQDENTSALHIPPFLVATNKENIRFLHRGVLEEPLGSPLCQGKDVMECMTKMVIGVSTHPVLPQVAMINADGLVQVHDYNTKRICFQREFHKIRVTIAAYSPSGTMLACGLTNGFLKILDGNTLQDTQSICISRSEVTKLEFSRDGTYLAVADTSFAVTVLICESSEISVADNWKLIGKNRPHVREIIGLHFANDHTGANRLFSIDQDSVTVEFDLSASCQEKNLKLKGVFPLNLTGTPTCISSTTQFRNNELFIVIADSGLKLRIYDTREFKCQKTFLGPILGNTINTLLKVPGQNTPQDCFIYTTEGQILGVLRLPNETQNLQYFGVVGHTGPISSVTISHDSNFVFTLSCHDRYSIVNVWTVAASQLNIYFEDEAFRVGKSSAQLLDENDSTFFQTIRELFFTAQIQAQGEEFPYDRKLDRSLPLEQVPNLLRALSLYPSNLDIEEIMNDIALPYLNAGSNLPKKIEYDDFLNIYMNHKSLRKLTIPDIEQAFMVLGGGDMMGTLDSGSLLKILQTEGEPMTMEEIQHCFDQIAKSHIDLRKLPRTMSGAWFSKALLGLQD